jgi:hypothetical protein
MERRRILGLGAGALLMTGVVVNAGQEPVLESTLARRAALLAARADLGGGSVPMLASTAVRVVGFAWHADDTPVVVSDVADAEPAGRWDRGEHDRYRVRRVQIRHAEWRVVSD